MASTLVAPVEDGKIVETSSQSSLAESKKTQNSAYSKDTFLKLLVAEVQNQDPLEPTSNTEWISQYATFSELEAMQNMSSSYDLSRASSLVGKTVVMHTTSTTGEQNVIEGKVDFVTYEAGKAYLSINGDLYSLDDLYNVVDTDYLNAFNKVYDWSVKLNKLPSLEKLRITDKDDVMNVYKEYEDMSEYEKTFVAQENADKIKEYYEKMQELIKKAEAAEEETDKPEEEEGPEGTDKTEGIDKTEGTGNTGNTTGTTTDEKTDGADETDETEKAEGPAGTTTESDVESAEDAAEKAAAAITEDKEG